MSISITIHDCTATVIEQGGKSDERWTDYTFIDAKGQKYEITVFHKTARALLRDKLSEFVSERERFETSNATGA